jgi:NHL repeat
MKQQTEGLRSFVSYLLLMTSPLLSLGQANYATPYTFATLAGGQGGYADGTGNAAQFSSPQGVAVDSAGNLYVADSGNQAIRKVTPAGVVTKLFRGGVLISPYGLAVDGATNIYVADHGGGVVRKLTLVGTNWQVSTVAGGFSAPYGVAVDGATNLYVADEGTSLIRKLTPVGTNWVVTTIAGPGGFNHPCGVAVDGATNVYVAGGNDHTIQKVTPVGTNWVVTTLAGLAGNSGTNDGIGTNAQFDHPAGVMVDTASNLYVADEFNSTIRQVTPVGTNWLVTTLAGLAGSAGTDDGTGDAARFDNPAAVAMDTAGDLYVADLQSNRIRRGFPANGTPVILTQSAGLASGKGPFGFNLAAAAGQPVVVDESEDLLTWLPFWTNTVGPGALPFSDSENNAYSKRFYRAHNRYARRPLGVYAKLDLSDVIKGNTNAVWGPFFDCLYKQLLSNPAISGLTLNVRWDLVNTAPDVYNWAYVTNAFNQVSNWNTMHPDTQKNIQCILTAGFNSPRWLLDSINSSDGSCDWLFISQGVQNCGTITFLGFNENADGNVLPLPWNHTYKAAWTNFLTEFNRQFGDNALFVSISVAGPTAGSAEMILPNDENTCPCHTNHPSCDSNCLTNGTPPALQPNGLTPSNMWSRIVGNYYGTAPTNTNEPFVEEWKKAIETYDQIFHGVTLVVTPGDGEGFPFLTTNQTDNPLCQYQMDSSCTAVASVLTYFEKYRSVNGNGKAVQDSGLRGDGFTLTNKDIDIGGVKLLSAQSATKNPWDQILGGAQFDHAFSGATQPEQDGFDVLAAFFNGTAGVYGTATFSNLFFSVPYESAVNWPLTNSAPLNFLQVYYQDVLYASSNGCVNIQAGAGGKQGQRSMSAQDLLNQASTLLFTIGETTDGRYTVPSFPPACTNSAPVPCQPP